MNLMPAALTAIKGLSRAGASDAVGVVGELASNVATALHPVAGAVVRVVSSLAELPFKLQILGDALLEGQRKLGDFNGQIGAAFAHLDIHRMMRDMRTANDTAGSVKELTQSQDRLENNLRPIEAWWTNVQNTIVSRLQGVASDIIEAVNGVAENVQNQDYPLNAIVNEVADRRINVRLLPPLKPLR